jgi:hypothetical protein
MIRFPQSPNPKPPSQMRYNKGYWKLIRNPLSPER